MMTGDNFFYSLSLFLSPAGPRLSGGHSLHETSSVLVETVTKTSKVGGAYSSSSSTTSSKMTSDASKVVCRGTGLSKALVGQKNNFTVDCSTAGEAIEIKHILREYRKKAGFEHWYIQTPK